MKKTLFLTTALCVLGIGFAYSAENFGWQKGKAEQASRSDFFSRTGDFKTQAEREAYFAKNGIGGDGPYHDAKHYDVENLVAENLVTQEEALKIKADAAKKHEVISGAFAAADFENMTKTEISQFYENLKK